MDGFNEHDKRVIRYALHAVLYFICLKILGAGWLASAAVAFTVLVCLVSNINRASIETMVTPIFWLTLFVFLSVIPEPSEWKTVAIDFIRVARN